MEKTLKFRGDEETASLFLNPGDHIGKTIRSIKVTERIDLTQGYGVSSKVPLRFLAYALPLFSLAKQLRNVRLIFYFALEGVKRANGLENGEGEMLSENVALMQKLLGRYISTFHPEMKEKTFILTDAPLDQRAKACVQGFLDQGRNIAASIPSIRRFIERRAGEASLHYMIEHSLYMRDPLLFEGDLLPLLVPDMDYNTDHIIMVGGGAEKVFWEFRKALQASCNGHSYWQSHQFFSTVGDHPPYHYQEGEPCIKDELPPTIEGFTALLEGIPDNFGRQRAIRKDYVLLLQDTGGYNQLLQWLGQ